MLLFVPFQRSSNIYQFYESGDTIGLTKLTTIYIPRNYETVSIEMPSEKTEFLPIYHDFSNVRNPFSFTEIGVSY